MIRILFFSYLQQRTGTERIELELTPGLTLGALVEKVRAEYPNLGQTTLLVAHNQNVVRPGDQALADGDEIAFLPPFAGG